MSWPYCRWCGARTRAAAGLCGPCDRGRRGALARIAAEGLIAETPTGRGGATWVWDKRGRVVVHGRDTRELAIRALALGEGMGDVP